MKGSLPYSAPVDKSYQYHIAFRAGRRQSIDVTDVAKQGAAFAATTNIVVVEAKEDCHIAVGTDPTATTGDTLSAGTTGLYFVSKGSPRFLHVDPGWKISAVRDTASGKLYITENAAS